MTTRRFALVLMTLALGGYLQAAEPTADRLEPPAGRIEMVLDSDMYNEVDDQFALAFAVRSPERIELKAVYAAPFLNHRSKSAGNGTEKSYHETLRVLKLLGEESEGRVFRGSDRFLADRNTSVDSLAARHLVRLAHQDREGPLYVVGLGAATNLASALLIDPIISDRIVAVWIGGHPYSWPHARDFNLKQDIAAAQVLFDSGVPLVHVPAGDVAASLKTTLPELEAGLKGKSPIADALYQNVDSYYTETGASRKQPRSGPDAWQKVIWDIATIAWLLEPEKMVTTRVVPSPILTDEGTWKHVEGRHPVRVAVKLDRNRVFEVLFQRLGGALLPPYPPSPVIAGIEWAPCETIVRRAKGSDNFPLTWSDDDALYATYGDGFGFEPFVPTKLSLGLARITGTPDDFRGVNLRSDSIEQYGEGRKGRKGWGLLSVV